MDKNIKAVKGIAKAGSIISQIAGILMIVAIVAVIIGALILMVIPSIMEVEMKVDVIGRLDKAFFESNLGEDGWKEIISEESFNENGEFVQTVTTAFTMKKLGIVLLATIVGFATTAFVFLRIKKLCDTVIKEETPFSVEVINGLVKLGTALIINAIVPSIVMETVTTLVLGMSTGSSLDLVNVALIVLGYVMLVYVLRYGITLRKRAEKAEAELLAINELEEKYMREEEEKKNSSENDAL